MGGCAIRRIGRFSKGSGGTKADEVSEGVPCIRYGDLYTSHKYHIRASRAFVTDTDALNYTSIRYGDILFAGSGETIEEIGKSAVNLIEQPARCGGDVILFRPEREVDARFSGYAIDCPQSQSQKSTMGRGITVMHIYGDELKNLWIALPSLTEQRSIARYLDHVDRGIQRYIEAKEKLITLLQEARQATIQRAVTRGLDPSAPLKPSGVDWLGDVPAHWEISRVKSEFISLNHRRVPLNAVERGEMKERRYDYYGASGVIDKVDHYLFDDELLLIAEDGANLVFRNLPLAIIARGKFWVNNHAHILKPRRGNLEFLAAVMEGLNYTPWISGAAQPKLTQERLMNIAIAVPSRSEQNEIMTKIESQTSELSAAIDNARRQVEFMTEYRSSLIAHVVTGKLDVRAAAEQLPQESRELAVS
ncbi:MAG: restriction endonuclease subunit S [Caldilineaceae bacterium]|nr:restriction endonuclease subunit S [Caldilineaceae bacterium]